MHDAESIAFSPADIRLPATLRNVGRHGDWQLLLLMSRPGANVQETESAKCFLHFFRGRLDLAFPNPRFNHRWLKTRPKIDRELRRDKYRDFLWRVSILITNPLHGSPVLLTRENWLQAKC